MILLWGSNAREAHPIFFHHMLKAIHAGAQMYAVDPRRTTSAQWADTWLGLNVGSDIALANAMAREIVHAGLHNREFIERATEGFEAYVAALEPYTLERGEELSGMPADVIKDVAHTYARAERAQICWTLGITEHHNAVDNVLALINLALLTGHVGRYGSGLNPLRGQNNVQGGGDMGAIPNRLPGFQDLETDPEAVAKFERAWDTKLKPHYGWHMTEMFEAMERGELTTLFVLGENPVQSDADAHHVKKLLGGLEHFVVQDIFLTATAEMADVVLPASASWAEAEGTVTNSERRVQRCRKALDPPGQARDDTRILVDLAARLGHEWHYESAEEIWDELRSLAPNHAGMSYRRLEELGGIQWPCFDEDKLEPSFLHGRLWEQPLDRAARGVPRRRGRSAVRQALEGVPAAPHHRPPAGLVQHRRADRRLQLAAAPARGARAVHRRRRGARRERRRPRAHHLAQRRGGRPGARRPRAAPGARVHDAALPRRGGDEHPHHQQHRPEVRDGRVQGDGHPRRAARSRRARGHVRRRRSGDPRRAAPLMDIVLHKDEPSAGERDAVDAVLGPPDSRWVGALTTSDRDRRVARGGHAARAQRHLLLPVLHAVQSRAGWISPGALNYICQRLTIPPAEAYGVATFYALFSLEPQPPAVAHVCTDIACMAGGAKQLCADLEARIGPKGGQHGSNGAGPGEDPIWLESPCLGMCEMAPVAMVSMAGEEPREVSVGHAEADDIAAMLAGGDAPAPAAPKVPQAGDPGLRLLRRVGRVDPTSVDSYRADGGYEALRAALEMGEQAVLREVTDAKLLGRGGAAFPTGRKWEAVAAHPTRPHYLICNADESEPGTFKDRVLLEHDPFSRHRVDDDRGLRHRLRARLPLPARRVPAGLGAPGRTPSPRRGRAASSARTSSAAASTSTSSCARARARTSAARRRRSSTRSRAIAASRATSRRSPSSTGCSTSRR